MLISGRYIQSRLLKRKFAPPLQHKRCEFTLTSETVTSIKDERNWENFPSSPYYSQVNINWLINFDCLLVTSHWMMLRWNRFVITLWPSFENYCEFIIKISLNVYLKRQKLSEKTRPVFPQLTYHFSRFPSFSIAVREKAFSLVSFSSIWLVFTGK